MLEQTTNSILMIAPSSFQFNVENAASNHFQHQPTASEYAVQQAAQAEFEAVVTALRKSGIDVTVYEHKTGPPKPDAIFPNNWFTTWPDGSVYLYPMAAANRRLERSTDVIDSLRHRFEVTSVTDISSSEREGRFLEATGAMVFDHPGRVVYASISNRCDEALLREHAAVLGYSPVVFHAYDNEGTPIYHTNVVMAVHATTAVVCLEAITDESERRDLQASLVRSGHEIIAITQDQLNAFCGNTLQLTNADGHSVLMLSETSAQAFTAEQLAALRIDKTLLVAAIPTIEQVGGGGIRCMLGELFLPKLPASADV